MTRRLLATLALVLPHSLVLPDRAAAAPLTVSSGDRTELRGLVSAAAMPPSSARPAAPAGPGPGASREEATALPPPCARKVKVVYPGYGEAARATCAAGELRPGG